jgi:hypothetical protein
MDLLALAGGRKGKRRMLRFFTAKKAKKGQAA